ncbi:hypothetical protein ASD55_15305 [Rhodanobacter sp. Root561]|nr:hypothetical protein ASD55_15305 [Rhodanobacter sp. Root561]
MLESSDGVVVRLERDVRHELRMLTCLWGSRWRWKWRRKQGYILRWKWNGQRFAVEVVRYGL